MTDTITNPLAGIEAALSADWTKFVAFVQQAESATASFLSAVATGAEIAIADIEAVASYVAGKLGTITATTAALSTAAAAIAPGNVTVQKANCGICRPIAPMTSQRCTIRFDIRIDGRRSCCGHHCRQRRQCGEHPGRPRCAGSKLACASHCCIPSCDAGGVRSDAERRLSPKPNVTQEQYTAAQLSIVCVLLFFVAVAVLMLHPQWFG